MHNPEGNGPREKSNPLIFIPLFLFGAYLIYLVVWLPFQYGAEKGLVSATYRPPAAQEEADEVFDFRQLRQPNDELIAQGARVYQLNCQSCHGPSGQGDGTAAAGLTVKPRAFAAEPSTWRVGASVLDMYQTLDEGVGAMPAMPALNPRQKFAVIHFVHDEFMEEWPEDSEEAIASLPAPAAGVELSIDPYAETRVPVRYAMRQLVRQAEENQD